MRYFQPLDDTINLLAGSRPPHHTRLGECFDAREPVRREKPSRTKRRMRVFRALALIGLLLL